MSVPHKECEKQNNANLPDKHPGFSGTLILLEEVNIRTDFYEDPPPPGSDFKKIWPGTLELKAKIEQQGQKIDDLR